MHRRGAGDYHRRRVRPRLDIRVARRQRDEEGGEDGGRNVRARVDDLYIRAESLGMAPWRLITASRGDLERYISLISTLRLLWPSNPVAATINLPQDGRIMAVVVSFGAVDPLDFITNRTLDKVTVAINVLKLYSPVFRHMIMQLKFVGEGEKYLSITKIMFASTSVMAQETVDRWFPILEGGESNIQLGGEDQYEVILKAIL